MAWIVRCQHAVVSGPLPRCPIVLDFTHNVGSVHALSACDSTVNLIVDDCTMSDVDDAGMIEALTLRPPVAFVGFPVASTSIGFSPREKTMQ